MLDLETWGKKPGCDLRSIGACVFDPIDGTVWHRLGGHNTAEGDGTFYIATDNPHLGVAMIGQPGRIETFDDGTGKHRKYPLKRDPQTVQWWSEQSAEAQAAFDNPVDLREALQAFAGWLEHVSPVAGDPIWSHGPAFDVAILAAAYDACGLPVPWHYRAPRDTRTAFDMAGQSDHSAFMQRFNTGTAHHALDDAISQAKAVCEAFRLVREPLDALKPFSDAAAELDDRCDDIDSIWENPVATDIDCGDLRNAARIYNERKPTK